MFCDALRISAISRASVNFIPTIFFLQSKFFPYAHLTLKLIRLYRYWQISYRLMSGALILIQRVKIHALKALTALIILALSSLQDWQFSIIFSTYCSRQAILQLNPWSYSFIECGIFLFFWQQAFQYFSWLMCGAAIRTLSSFCPLYSMDFSMILVRKTYSLLESLSEATELRVEVIVLSDDLLSQDLKSRELFLFNHLNYTIQSILLSNTIKMNRMTSLQLQVIKQLDSASAQKPKAMEVTARIFPPQSQLFENKQERSLSDPKINLKTVSSFKPKLEMRPVREIISCKVNKNLQKHRQIDIKTRKHKNRYQLRQMNRMIESQFKYQKEEANLKPDSRPALEKPQPQSATLVEMHVSEKKQKSPSSIYSSNNFPRKEVNVFLPKCKLTFSGIRNDQLNELAFRTKNALHDRMEEQYTVQDGRPHNMLELMTIFSIKEQSPSKFQSQKLKSFKESHSRKRQLFKSLTTVNSQYTPKIQPKRYLCVQEEPEINFDKVYQRKINSFMKFANKVRYSNNMPLGGMILRDRFHGEKIKVYVGHGNNRYLILALLKRRFWLELTNKITADTKFIWTQNSIRDVHAIQKKLTSPAFKTQKTGTEPSQAESYTNSPETQPVIQQQFQSRNTHNPGFIQTYSSVSLSPSKKSFKKRNKNEFKLEHNKKLFLNEIKAERVERMLSNCRVITRRKWKDNEIDIQTVTNHVPQNSFIGSKKALFYTMEHYYRNVKKVNPFSILPKTYHFKKFDEQAYNKFIQTQKGSKHNIWIVKPGQCTNRGNGIYLVRGSQISKKILKRQNHTNGLPKTTILQSYLSDSLLYHGRKFDIRHYMMITIVNGILKAYWYSQGYLRTSSEYFTLDNLSNLHIHLTNDAIQKNSQKYGKYEPGNKVSYSDFQKYLDSAHSSKKKNFREHILRKMKEIATDVVRANYLNIDKQRRMNNFEIFGLDFMIDKDFRPWLIEINANPCLQISCPLLSRIVPTMVEHSLRLGIDPLFLPSSHYPPNHRYYLSDNFVQNLRYEIIFDQLQNKEEQGGRHDYDFQFEEPEDEYENQGTEIDLAKLLD